MLSIRQLDRTDDAADRKERLDMNQTTRKAYAKINIGLDVLRRRENGYHEVRMIMQTVNICDDLILEKTVQPGISILTNHKELPVDQNNLIYKAAELMRRQYDIRQGVRIHFQKNIPIAAGMAGGSTDAAATMKGMNRLFGLALSPGELRELGVQIGADVPYCVTGGTALAEGIGEKLTMLPPAPQCTLLVAKPDINVSTKYVYEHLDAAGVAVHPDIDGMVEAIRQGTCRGLWRGWGMCWRA